MAKAQNKYTASTWTNLNFSHMMGQRKKKKIKAGVGSLSTWDGVFKDVANRAAN